MLGEVLDVKNFDIHTADAYYGNVKWHKNNLVIPYINLALFDYQKSRFEKTANFVDYGYLIFFEVTESTMVEFELVPGNTITKSLILGGVRIDKTPFKDTEFAIKATKAYFQLTPISRISDNKINGIDFIPIETPNFRPTLDEATTKRFLNFEFLNPEFKQLFWIS